MDSPPPGRLCVSESTRRFSGELQFLTMGKFTERIKRQIDDLFKALKASISKPARGSFIWLDFERNVNSYPEHKGFIFKKEGRLNAQEKVGRWCRPVRSRIIINGLEHLYENRHDGKHYLWTLELNENLDLVRDCIWGRPPDGRGDQNQ
jgi:hypothetical protein